MTSVSQHPRLPANRFFWAVLTPDLPLSAIRKPSAMTRALLAESFAAHVPVDLSRIAPAYTVLPDNTVLACGLPVTTLADHPNALTLAPETLPDWLDQTADPETLNVLLFEHEPAAITAARRKRSMLVTATAALLLAGLGVGLERRAASDRHSATEAGTLLAGLATSPSAKPLNLADKPFDDLNLTLDRELGRLRATRSKQASLGLQDAATPLATLFASWPRDVQAQVQTLAVAPGQITISVQLPAHEDAEKFSAALAKSPAWQPSQPQVNTTGKGVQMQLTLKPKGGVP